MADSMSVNNSGIPKIDITKWKKLTAQEIIKEEGRGEEIPAEIVTWAQQMAALAKIPDDVTYEQVDGDVGLEALDKLGIPAEEVDLTNPEAENAEAPTETEEPDAVKDPALTQDVNEETEDENIFQNPLATNRPTSERKDETQAEVDELSLADSTLSTDLEEIRKRKIKKGLQ